MGLIKEPKGVDFIVGPSVYTEQDRQIISEIIANYERTGKLPLKARKNGRGKRKHTSEGKSRILA